MLEPSEILKSLRGSAEFHAVMEGEMKAKRPLVPAYHATYTQEDQYKQEMTLRTQAARQEGFDSLWFALTGKRLDSTTQGDSSNG